MAALAVFGCGAAPGAVVAAAARRGDRFVWGLGAIGRLWYGDDAPLVTPATFFDLASLTKPVTALSAARLVRQGKLAWGEALAAVLPKLAGSRSARLPLELLAAHRAGLDGHRPLYAPLLEGKPVDRTASLFIAADARRASCPDPVLSEGFPPEYSDLGYLLLGEAVAARSEAELDLVQEREVIAPLELRMGSARLLRGREPRFDETVAPTEVVAFRGGAVRGAVHDENAWAIVGDASAGHAGIFGDAPSVLMLGVAMLEALAGRLPSWLAPEDLAPLLRDRPGGSLLAGFDRRSGATPSSGRHFGARTFGHLGFTGTSLWIDPDRALVGVLLTNRVHPTRSNTDAIRRARPLVYDALFEAMLGERAPSAP